MANDPFGTGETADQWDSARRPRPPARTSSSARRAQRRRAHRRRPRLQCNYLASDFQALARDSARVPAAVEYVGGSVTSPGLVKGEAEVRAAEPWNVQYDGAAHGYGLMALDAGAAVTEYRRSDLTSALGPTVAFERFTQPSGRQPRDAGDARAARQALSRPRGLKPRP